MTCQRRSPGPAPPGGVCRGRRLLQSSASAVPTARPPLSNGQHALPGFKLTVRLNYRGEKTHFNSTQGLRTRVFFWCNYSLSCSFSHPPLDEGGHGGTQGVVTEPSLKLAAEPPPPT